MLLRAACSDGSQRALCVAAMLVLMAMPRALEGRCRSLSSGGDSSTASSEEDAVGSEDARVQRCVRTAAPSLMDGGYIHVARVDACASEGMDAIAAGAPPADAAATISQCVDGQPFPADMAPAVADFKDCVHRALT